MKFTIKDVFLVLAVMITSMTSFKSYSQDAHQMWLEGSKGKLYALLQYPDEVKKDVKYPLVIICHGFSGNCESEMQKDLADDIVRNGMAALRFDFNGHGKSEGLFQDMTVPNEIEDLKDVIKWAQKQPWVESIGLVGHSQGGVVVSMVAGELGNKIIKAEALMAPAAVLRDDALRGSTMGAYYDPYNIQGDYVELPGSPEAGSLKLGKAYIETAMTLPIYETARKYTGPTLILQGTHDRVVPYTYAERYHEEIKGSQLKLIEGDNHMFSNSLRQSCQFVANWMKTQLEGWKVINVNI